MGHLLSKHGYRVNKRSRKQHHRKKARNCFLRGPCMLCFIVHGNSGGLDDDNDQQEASGAGRCHNNSEGGRCHSNSGGVSGASAVSKLAGRYATLASPDDCARFLLSPRELAIWEGQGRSLLSGVPAKLVQPPGLFRSVGVSVAVPLVLSGPGSSVEYSDMVTGPHRAMANRK